MMNGSRFFSGTQIDTSYDLKSVYVSVRLVSVVVLPGTT